MNCFSSKISTPHQELQYLKKINALDIQLQAKYNNIFFANHNIQKRYETIFKPITQPLNKSLQQQHHIHQHLQQQQQQEDHHQPISPPMASSSRRKKELLTPAKKKHPIFQRNSLTNIDSDDDDNVPDFTLMDEGDDDDVNDFNISRFIKKPDDYGIRDNYFGITQDTKSKKSQLYKFLGNTIQITGNPSSSMKISNQPLDPIEISSRKIWEMIVLTQPFRPPTHTDLVEYGNILLANNFEKWIKNKRNTTSKRAMLNSPKYLEIIVPALNAAKGYEGKGISYYTFHPPPSKKRSLKKKKENGIRRRNIEFFPANKKVLLKKLIYLLGEFHCGNNRLLRNEIVPIVDYLKSQKALPHRFDTKRMKWIYD